MLEAAPRRCLHEGHTGSQQREEQGRKSRQEALQCHRPQSSLQNLREAPCGRVARALNALADSSAAHLNNLTGNLVVFCQDNEPRHNRLKR